MTPCRFALLFLLACGPVASAQGKLDAGAGAPYDVQVVLHIVENRFLTPLFQGQLQRDIEDKLQLAFGPLARVKVVRTHPLVSEIEAEGLGKTLDVWDELSTTRTCFVLVEYVAGRYRLQVRQHCGFTGLSTPVVRQVQVSDRAGLAQVAVDLLRRDFGLVADVESVAGDQATLVVRGGALVKNISDWIHPGQVFAVCRLTDEGERPRSTRLAWTALEALPVAAEKGKVRCRLWRRFAADDLQPEPGVLGYRCMLLPPTRASLRVRFLDDKTFEPRVGLAVHVRRPGDKEAAYKKSTDLSGLVEVKDEFANLAIVLLPAGARAQVVPIALVDDRTVVVATRAEADAEERAALDYRVALWERRLVENLRLNAERVKEINEQIVRSFEQALETARHAAKSLGEEVNQLEHDQADLRSLASKLKVKVDLTRGSAVLHELGLRQKEMQERTERYEAAVKDGGDRTALGLKSLVEKAKLHEDLAEFDQALETYDALLKVSPELATFRAHRDKLRAAWDAKGPEHAKARQFIVAVWPRLEVMALDKYMAEVKAALATCKEANDRLTPLRLMRANIAHAAALQRRRADLERQSTEDSRNQLKLVARAAAELLEIETAARALAGKRPLK